MDGDLFVKWFHFHFLKHAPSERPILILLDGHSSHYNPKVIREAALAGVILFCLPPNITHTMCVCVSLNAILSASRGDAFNRAGSNNQHQ